MYTRLILSLVLLAGLVYQPVWAEEKKAEAPKNEAKAEAAKPEAEQPPPVYAIPGESVDDQKIFWGKSGQFSKPGEVDYKTIVKSTPEYESIRENRIESGTAKYWILISKASDRAVQTIAAVGEESDYDFIAAEGYLGSLEPAIPADNLTDLVLARLDEKKKSGNHRNMFPGLIQGRAFSVSAEIAMLSIMLAVAMITAGCVSSSDNLPSPVGADPSPGNMADDNKAASELAVAQRMVRAGDYSMVIPRLINIADKYPGTKAGTEAKYFLGLTYYQIGGFRNALNYFGEYLDNAPDGQYAELSREYMAGLSGGDEELNALIERLQKRIEAAKAGERTKPEDFADQLELADAYWRSKRYYDAGEIYKGVIGEFPEMEFDATIRKRIERAVDGSFIVLTPEEVERRYSELEPLLIVNTNTYRSGRFQGWSRNSLRDLYYHVSGQALNRGERSLRNVEIIVTIYGFGDLVYDTRSVRLGAIQPGTSRAFSVKFSNFDNIENITRYECTGQYEY